MRVTVAELQQSMNDTNIMCMQETHDTTEDLPMALRPALRAGRLLVLE